MASGDTVVQIFEVMPPGTLAALQGVRAGGSTPAESMFHWAFNDTTIWYMDFKCKLEGYGGGGLTFTLPWMSDDQTTGTVTWGIAIRRLADDAEDIDSSHDYNSNFNDTDDTTASAAGELSYPTISFTDGVDMDSWSENELAIVRVRRNVDGTDDMTGDAQLCGLFGLET